MALHRPLHSPLVHSQMLRRLHECNAAARCSGGCIMLYTECAWLQQCPGTTALPLAVPRNDRLLDAPSPCAAGQSPCTALRPRMPPAPPPDYTAPGRRGLRGRRGGAGGRVRMNHNQRQRPQCASLALRDATSIRGAPTHPPKHPPVHPSTHPHALPRTRGVVGVFIDKGMMASRTHPPPTHIYAPTRPTHPRGCWGLR